MPAVVVLARERAHVEHTLRIASRLGIPVVPQGARSGLSGAANAVDGGIVLSLERMDRIVEIDAINRIAVVEPGRLQRDVLPGGRRARAVLSAGPVELGVLLHRRESGDQLRRAVLRQVRRDDRLCARPRSRVGIG